MNTFDYLVIGAGLMGSAAIRYLAQWSPNVAIIGPAEPRQETLHNGVFASHYDQGRLTLRLSKDVTWSRLADRAINNYRWLEQQSDIPFYTPVGRLAAEATHSPTPERDAALSIAAAEGLPYTLHGVGDDSWRTRFPYLDFPADFWVLHEPEPAGVINPRAMLHAQMTIAGQSGATILRETAVRVEEDDSGVTVTTDMDHRYRANKVIVAAGAFTNFNNLLPYPIPLKIKTETILLGGVTSDEAARLADMPTVNYQIHDPDIDDIYMTPPLRYADGDYYVKMGCNTRTDAWPTTLADVQKWFQRGNSDACKPAMVRALQSLLPTTDFTRFETRRCIVCYTPSGLPTIDTVSPRIVVATGGNGSGAKGSDTLGHLAAGLLFDGRWLDDIPRAPFQLRDWDEANAVD